jgi:protein arginine N-methyltransferase 5
LEVAYAAFCGVVNLVVPGPRAKNGTNGVAQYARAIKQALSTGAYVQFHILMPVDFSKPSIEEDLGDLTRFVRPEYAANATQMPDSFASWDAWNTIRSICKYNSRLSVGK